ncbi:MAG: protein kinase [Gemmatimonadales bacterium]
MPDLLQRLQVALTGRYLIQRELGRGGMAIVYLARDLRHDRPVALKVLESEWAGAVGPERFLREIAVTARLDHPHILPVLDSGEAGSCLYYVMPLVEGESLRDRLAREKQLPLDDALRIAGDVADALSYAHSHDVVHRDIKPENILLAGGHARVADFGIARAVSAAGARTLTATGLAIGTPAYMSPEQAAGERDLDGRADIYALGCVLYEMLAGEPPFTGPTAQAILARRLTDPVPRLRNVRESVPAEVDHAVAKALARVPADRFSTAADFAAALVVPPDALPSRRGVRTRSRNAIIGAAVVVTLTGLGIALFRDQSPSASSHSGATIAVLYFDNRSADTADAYLADGLTEALIARLGEVGRLTVKSRTAVQPFRGQSTGDPQALGSALGATHLVSGTVRRSGPRIRVTVELARTVTGVRVWGDQYDRTDTDLLAIEEDVARGIASAIAGQLLPAEQASLAARPTASPEAYDHFLRGNFYLARRSPRDAARAIEEYEEAVRLDPRFAQAMARIGYGYALFLSWGWQYPGLPRDSLLARGLGLVDRAMRWNPTNSDVWMARAYLLSERDPRAFTGVIAAFQRALDLDPRNAEAYHQYGWVLWLLGDDSAAAQSFHRALELDAARAITLEHLARMAFAGRHDAEARRWLDSALSLDPDFAFARQWRARQLLRLGDTAGARAEAELAVRLGVPEGGEEVLALVEVHAGDTPRARARLDRFLRDLPQAGPLKFQQAVYAAAVLVAAGEEMRALDLLERVALRGGGFWSHLRMPEFDAIRSHPRFRRLIADSRPPADLVEGD